MADPAVGRAPDGGAIDPALRTRIEDFLLDYAHAIDDGEVEAWPGFFTEDAVYQVTTREAHEAGLPVGIMYCEGRGMMQDRVEALRTANIFEPHTYCHLLGRPRLSADSPDAVLARTNFQIVRTMQDGGSALFAAGKYLDRIAIDQGGPRLAERRVILESRRIDILLVFPI